VAVGIYPLASLLNHDCNPNCVAINNGPSLEVSYFYMLSVRVGGDKRVMMVFILKIYRLEVEQHLETTNLRLLDMERKLLSDSS